MRIAVYGGSFDPLHVGHLMVASWLRWTDQADEVWLLVSHRHPFHKDSAPFDARVGWCRAVTADLPGIDVCDVEGRLPGLNYTIDTLEWLAKAHSTHRFRFVLGSDTFAAVDRWHRWSDIEAGYAPIVVARAGHLDAVRPPGPVFPEVSSTDIRERARRGASIAEWVPGRIVDLVLQHHGSPQNHGGPPST
ncbi:MAG: nicotinate-nicotinamide nucleotide adenylyltransferase [Myxococcota bacterium]